MPVIGASMYNLYYGIDVLINITVQPWNLEQSKYGLLSVVRDAQIVSIGPWGAHTDSDRNKM